MKKQYTDNDKALALATLDANAGNLSKTAKMLRMPRQTLQEWAHNSNVNKDVPNLRQEKKGELAERLEEVAHALTGNLLTRAHSELSTLVPMKDVATSLGIVIDKMRLLNGEATTITQELLSGDDRERIKDELRRDLRLVKKGV